MNFIILLMYVAYHWGNEVGSYMRMCSLAPLVAQCCSNRMGTGDCRFDSVREIPMYLKLVSPAPSFEVMH